MTNAITKVLLWGGVLLAGIGPLVAAQAWANQIEDLEVVERGGEVHVRVGLSEPLQERPASFTVAEPARIAFDFPATTNALGRSQQQIDRGSLRSAHIIQAGDRTRLVLNLSEMTRYSARVEGNDLLITLAPGGVARASTAEQAIATYAAASQAVTRKSLQDVLFRRGEDGEARILVQLSSPEIGINVREEGRNLIVEFGDTYTPEHLRRRSDVTDFATPVRHMTVDQHGDDSRLVVTSRTRDHWEHNAYQTDTQFVLEVRPLEEDRERLVQGVRPGEYGGEKLSLNFQDVDVRSVLQVIADFTDFNIVTSDSVQGNLTLRLQDVPWDQALDIILQAKGLDKRVTGNVIWIAPSEELAARQQMELESRAQMGDLEPLQTESMQINYHRAEEIHEFLKDRDQTMLSERGSVVFDQRSNKLFVTDTRLRLEEIRRLIREIDVAPRQVLIEARVVEATQDFAKDLGVRLELGSSVPASFAQGGRLGLGRFDPDSGMLVGEGFTSGGDAPATTFSQLNLALFNRDATRFLNLELAALESDGRGRVVSSPRVLTANLVEALIRQGQEVPFVTPGTPESPPTVDFKDAVLSLGVRPQITPDGKVQMQVEVNKDRPDFTRSVQGNPPIDTQSIQTEVLVENGGTVVIGGVFEEEEFSNIDRVPVLGEMPVLGPLFRRSTEIKNRRELLIFITPRIVTDSLTLR